MNAAVFRRTDTYTRWSCLLWAGLLLLLPVMQSAYPQTTDAKINRAVASLASAVSGPVTVGIGGIPYGKADGLGAPFSEYLKGKLSSSLNRDPAFTLVEREQMDAIIGEIKLGLSGLIDESSAPQPGQIAALQSMLLGYYVNDGTNILVFLRLINTENAETLATAEISIPKNEIPGGIALLPQNYQNARELLDELEFITGQESPEFQVRLWTARGDGATYLDGEELVIKFFSDRDCYIKIFHIDVEGNTQLIFPNKYHRNNKITAEKIYSIPGSEYPFRFLLGEPYGVEHIKVIADTAQFSDIEESFTTLGSASRSLMSRGLSVKAASGERAEAMTSYTIVEKAPEY